MLGVLGTARAPQIRKEYSIESHHDILSRCVSSEHRKRALTFVNLAEGTATELLDDSVAFVQNFLALLKHYFNYNSGKILVTILV